MLTSPDFMRALRTGEEDAVDDLLRASFGGGAEASLVRDLRKSGAMAGEIVMPMGDRIIGYYALSQMIAPAGWLALAPVAIHPDMQGRRFGSRMMGFLGAWAQASGARIVVLGKVSFYERAGFSNARAAKLETLYPLAHMMLLAPGKDVPTARLVYPKAF